MPTKIISSIKRQITHKRLAVFATVIAVFALVFVLHAQRQPTTPTFSASGIDLLKGQWAYMPGDTVTTNGLVIGGRNFAIVEQDGSGGQPNPPVNEYGTHLNVQGDFRVDTELTAIQGPATVHLYATPPPVSDEFRVEPKSIALTINGHQLVVNRWDGNGTQDLANQVPALTKNFRIPGDDQKLRLSLIEEKGQMSITVNGATVGTIPSEQSFGSGQIWFGFSAQGEHDHFTVSRLTASSLHGGTVVAVNTAAEAAIAKSSRGLQQLASKVRPGFLVGTDLATWAATSSNSYDNAVFSGNYGIVTPENAMKWEFTEPQPGVYDFHEADAIVAMAQKNHLQVHGHNLVFGEALPGWVQQLPTSTPPQKDYVKQVLYNHVYAMVSHYKGQVDEWDINEPFASYDSNGNIPNSGFVNSVFYRALGEGYVRVVAQAAIAANPNVRLWVNDFGAENDTAAYWSLVYSTLKKWKEDWDLPIYGYGFESHIYDPTTDDISNAYDDNGGLVLTDHINQLAMIGLKSRISEFDAPQSDPGYAQDNSSQVQQITGTLRLCLDNPNCVAFSTWSTGMTDLSQSDSHQLQQSVDSMFDLQNQPTAAYKAVQSMLQGMVSKSN